MSPYTSNTTNQLYTIRLSHERNLGRGILENYIGKGCCINIRRKQDRNLPWTGSRHNPWLHQKLSPKCDICVAQRPMVWQWREATGSGVLLTGVCVKEHTFCGRSISRSIHQALNIVDLLDYEDLPHLCNEAFTENVEPRCTWVSSEPDPTTSSGVKVERGSM